jgi:hypothetical protein
MHDAEGAHAQPDVRVPVLLRAEPGERVVQVNPAQVGDADMLVERRHCGRGQPRVAGRNSWCGLVSLGA